jgi:hypothetical protein
VRESKTPELDAALRAVVFLLRAEGEGGEKQDDSR